MSGIYNIKHIPDSIKTFKPVTPSLRHRIKAVAGSRLNIKFDPLTLPLKSKAGRNRTGRITVRHRGGGHKKRVRLIDYHGNIGAYSKSQILHISYDPNRSGYLAFCKTPQGKYFYRMACYQSKPGDILTGKYVHDLNEFNIGDILPLKNIPLGTTVNSIGKFNDQGGTYCRSAGTSAFIQKHNNNNTSSLILNNNKVIDINSNSLAQIGRINNIFHEKTVLGKAGLSRRKGRRPNVRGEAMNPIDHPHGGKTAGGVRLKTVYGKLAKFVKTANK